MTDRNWPSFGKEETADRVEGGLGVQRHPDYAEAPYAEIVHAIVPFELWGPVFFSWLSMKGHLQGLHDLSRTELFATRVEDSVLATFITVWRRREGLVEWMQHGYPVEEMLRHVGVSNERIDVHLLRDFS